MNQNEQSIYELLDAIHHLPPKELKRSYERLVKKFPKPNGSQASKSEILKIYRELVATHKLEPSKHLEKFLQKKPVRTLSGVTPVTVLTKPFPCPGKCIFCPTDVRMPKSYIASEPGAQRAAQNAFDPYAQMITRLQTYKEIGHDIGKIELIVLGGTWSVYPEPYQIWFIKRLFQALNDFSNQTIETIDVATINLNEKKPKHESYNRYISRTKYIQSPESATWEELDVEHQKNERAHCRCVGLVLETRPDNVTPHEVIRLRRLGATKIQIGIQSVNNTVLALNKRGHTIEQTIEAFKLLRQAGFKIHAHWMPNLYGNNPQSDKKEYETLFTHHGLKPDELKVYPCSLIDDTELMTVYEKGEWQPYSHQELADVLTYCLHHTPEYCRLTRIVRDIPSQEIVAGNKHTNFRQMVEKNLKPTQLHDIRAREIKGQVVDPNTLILEDITYDTLVSTEHFLQYITPDRKIAAFLRLSLPKVPPIHEELQSAAIIREIHVYGQAIAAGKADSEVPQHQGMGTKLISHAAHCASLHHYQKLAVISAIGTRDYYRKKGFVDGMLYQHYTLASVA